MMASIPGLPGPIAPPKPTVSPSATPPSRNGGGGGGGAPLKRAGAGRARPGRADLLLPEELGAWDHKLEECVCVCV
jgi:hypothetical protein